ncbi:MAG: hypothetical protein QMC62_14290 [Alteromonadaceae bacterium]
MKNLTFKPKTFQMIDQVAEWGSLPRARVIEGIIENHFSNIRSRKVVLTFNNDLWKKLTDLSTETETSRESVLRLALSELL